MMVGILVIILCFLFFAVAVAEFFIILKSKSNKNTTVINPQKPDYSAYEIAILNELSGKIDYSFDVQDVVHVIIDSLPEVIDYDAVCYAIPLPEKIIFRAYLNKSVAYEFIEDAKSKTTDYLSNVLNRNIKDLKIEETIRGSVLDSESIKSITSFLNVPLIVSGKIVGLLMIASRNKDFLSNDQLVFLKKIIDQSTGALTNLRNLIDAENSKLNAMVASMADGVIMTDMNNGLLVANPKAQMAANLEGKKDLSLADFDVNLKGKIDLRDKIEESVRLEKIYVSDEISLQSGFYKVVISPVKNKWRPLGCVVVFRDITREKEVQRIKDDFTSMIVHELRSPLDSIKKMIEMMRLPNAKQIQQDDCLQMIYGSSSDMLELVNNLLDMAKIEAGKFDLKKQPSSILEIIKTRVLFFDIAARDAKVKITSQTSNNIPEKVNFDPHTISQVLNNLISNAIKFNKDNGSVVVQALLHKNGQSVVDEAKENKIDWFVVKEFKDVGDSLFVAVTNTGAGIAPDQIGRLFNKFFQVKSDFAQKGGTGLGLAITKSIIESHGGIVGAESVYGQGATFYFTIPI